MKRFVTILAAILILSACGGGPGESSSSQPDQPSSSSQSQSAPGGLVLTEEQEDALAVLGDLVSREDFAALCEKSGFVPNRMVRTAPSGLLLYYREEFEESTGLWSFCPERGEGAAVPLGREAEDRQLCVKGMLPAGEDEVLLILGHRYGTVSPGGDVYLLDAAAGELRSWYATGDSAVQVTKLRWEGEKLMAAVLTYGENMMDPVETERELPSPRDPASR